MGNKPNHCSIDTFLTAIAPCQALTNIPGERVGKCGCISGCNFFGQNSSGVRFFEPEERDLSARKNVAVPCIRF